MGFFRQSLSEMQDLPGEGGISGASARANVLWTVCLFLFCGLVVSVNLGAPALFDPDEGRNAEIAREILLLDDWVTPHYNFTSRLDKPMSFYALVAASFEVFGISEWSARFPSAVSALGTLAVVYLFASKFLGLWQARWAALILLSSAGFLTMSGITIFDMTLTFFVTVTLLSFFWACSAKSATQKSVACVLMYSAMGGATLVKGVIGVVIPGMVVFVYLLLTAQWSLLRRMKVPLGIGVYLLIVLPWYLWAEVRNPGYLSYFILEEHLLRFTSSEFGRTQPWFYYFLVLPLGFLPWTAILPPVIAGIRRRLRSHATSFLVLWIVVPFVFFSLSDSKLPHYILPTLPPLAMITGMEVVSRLGSPHGHKWPLFLPAWTMILLTLASLAVIGFFVGYLPRDVGTQLQAGFPHAALVFLIGSCVALVFSAAVIRKRLWQNQPALFVMTAVVVLLFHLGNLQIKTAVARVTSSKALAKLAAPLIAPGSRVAVYDAYLAGLPFYLRIEHPLILVWSGKGPYLAGSRYVANGMSRPAPGYRETLFTFEEFEESLNHSRQELFVFVPRKKVNRVSKGRKTRFTKLLEVNEVVLLKYEP